MSQEGRRLEVPKFARGMTGMDAGRVPRSAPVRRGSEHGCRFSVSHQAARRPDSLVNSRWDTSADGIAEPCVPRLFHEADKSGG